MDKNKIKEYLGAAISSLYRASDYTISFCPSRNRYVKDAKKNIDKALGELQKTDWISVKDELPEYGEKVVVCDKYYKPNNPWVTFRDIKNIYPKDENDFRELAGTCSFNITHWKHI